MVNGRNDTLTDKAEQIAEDAGKNVAEIGRELHHHAEHAKSDMVKNLYDAAKALRKQVREAGAGGDVQARVDEMATGFEKAAGYLKRNSYGDIGEDAARIVKRSPLRTLAVIFVVGVIIGLLLRANPSHDEQ